MVKKTQSEVMIGRSDDTTLKKRVEFLRFAMADIVARGEYDDFGLYRIINRIAFVTTDQVVFVVFRMKEGEDWAAVVKEISVVDPVSRSQLYRALEIMPHENAPFVKHEIEVDENAPVKLEPEVLRDYGVQIFDSHYYLLLFRVKRKRKPPVAQLPKSDLIPIRKDEPVGSFFYDVLKPFDGEDGRILFTRINLNQHIEQLYDESAVQNVDSTIATRWPISDDHKGWVEECHDDLQTLVHAERERLGASPILRSFLDNVGAPTPSFPINLHYIQKAFTRSAKRAELYHYEPTYIIDETQQNWLKVGLAAIRDRREDFIPYGDRVADDAFWAQLQKRGGYARIVRTLRSELPGNALLFVENALLSGTIVTWPSFFSEGSVGYLKDPDAMQSKHREAALFHFACLHYVLQLGSPVRPRRAGSTLAVQVVPFRASGGLWMVACYVRVNKEYGETRILDNEAFENCYLLYHSLIRESERRLRRKARNAYLELVKRAIFATTFEAKDPLRLTELETDELHYKLAHLTRFFPFPLIELVPRSDLNQPWKRGIRLVSNPFFDRRSVRDFINENKLAKDVDAQIQLALRLRGIDEGADAHGTQ